MKPSSKPVRYGVVGVGHIAQVAVLPAFEHAQNSELAALITGDPTKEKKLSKKYQRPAFHYDDFERAVEEAQLDAVYIALPNTQHRPFTERAARAGVHVLCEKPMATTEKDCRAMIAACEKADVRLMIAYRLHFTPAHLQAIALARSGKLGELRYFSSIFGMQVKPDNIRTDPADGGGPLRDLGVYCINAARYLFGDEPTEVRASPSRKAATSASRRSRKWRVRCCVSPANGSRSSPAASARGMSRRSSWWAPKACCGSSQLTNTRAN
jgi:glucose-fructose oxidoreductase